MIALVTGASGFVGRALCARLVERGATVRAAVRGGHEIPGTHAVPITDIETFPWSASLDGVDTVFHAAARVHAFDSDSAAIRDAYRRTNVDATVALAEASAAAGVRHFVFLSSVKAAGERTSAGRPFSENDPCHPEDAYGWSKYEAETALNRIRDTTSMDITVVRPPLVYGPCVKANFLRMMRAVDRRMPLPVGSIRNARSLVYIENLVHALLTCAEGGRAASRTFFVSDGEDVSTPELVRLIARSLDRKPLLIPVPVSLLKAAGRLTGRRAMIDRLLESLTVDISAIRSALNWQPPYRLSDGLAATAEWYRRSGDEA